MDPIASLSRLERFLMRIRSQRGTRTFVAVVAGVSILLSLLLTAPLLVIIEAPARDFVLGLMIAVLVPALVAPTIALWLARLLKALDQASSELRHLAHVDGLTGVRNRRAFVTDALALWSAADAGDGPATLLVGMVDMDKFKAVNDIHGHAVGDRALQALATNLRDAIGDAGVVGRLGGDEFALVAVLPNAEEALEHHRQRLGFACKLDAVLPGLRATAGTIVTTTAMSLDEALSHADHALYRSKPARGASRAVERPDERRDTPVSSPHR